MSRRSLHSVRERRRSLPQLARNSRGPRLQPVGSLHLPKRVLEPAELVVEHSSTNSSSEVKRCTWR